MALTLLSFFALAIAGFGGCQALTRRMALPTNALINLGLGFFVAMALVCAVCGESGDFTGELRCSRRHCTRFYSRRPLTPVGSGAP